MKKISLRELVLMGILTAVLFMGQVFMAFLPNIEIVSLLIVIYTIVFGRRVFLMIYTFVLLEGIFYGFGLWWINYLYVWSILALVVLCFRQQKSTLFFSIVSGFFGFAFGALCALPYFAIGGVSMAFSYWVSGIPFDIAHCIGNFVLCLMLFGPLTKLLGKLRAYLQFSP